MAIPSDNRPDLVIRLAAADDDDFILGLVGRFVEFELPPWRRKGECAAGIRADVARHLAEQPPGSHVFVAEDDAGERAGFLHGRPSPTGSPARGIATSPTSPSHRRSTAAASAAPCSNSPKRGHASTTAAT